MATNPDGRAGPRLEPIEITRAPRAHGPRYSVCTLVTDPAQYATMCASFRAGGFDHPVAEYLWVDNTRGNRLDAFAAVERFLDGARGTYVILCHQDVRLLTDDRHTLDRRIAELDTLDPDWALLGNAGGTGPGRLAIRISDPQGEDTRWGPFPARVDSLDENFVLVRREARLGVSRGLSGFHFYATDLCLQATLRGRTAYVVDFHLRHLGGRSREKARPDPTFPATRDALAARYGRMLHTRWVQTPNALLLVSPSPLLRRLATLALVRSLARRWHRWRQRLPAQRR